ncbi:MAG: insulinase family protein [Spirochaetales bacterium]|nr:insulinase family protein [Spirochaetales bacterium]
MKHLSVGDRISGFRVTAVKDLPEYHSIGIRLLHEATGCDLYHMANEDPENLFAFVFRTPPNDNTGVSHIIEHSVLSGSDKYPIKDPFLALMRGSMNTFLNAMTYPDKTIYPAASPSRKDYFNLMEVYGDSVFFPLLKEEIFLQEGWRFEPKEGGSPDIAGIVFNEMRGNYSSHDSILAEWSYRTLYPDTPYHFDSGGDPLEIPELTYRAFKEFHAKYYHPSNSKIFLYGDIPTEELLSFIDDRFLSRFERIEVDSRIPDQPRWEEPCSFSFTSPLSAGEDATGKSSILVNWATIPISDPLELLSMEVLSEILIGNPGTPLYKAIVESRLGEDLSPLSGIETDMKEVVFSLGLRGTDPDKIGDFEDLILQELKKLISGGIPEDVKTGALRRVEFRNREIRGGVPFGLRCMGKTLRGWLHGLDPETTLEFSRWMEELKQRVKDDPACFESYIKEHLVENQHRTTVIVTPSADHEKQQEEKLRSKVEDRAEALGAGKIQEDYRKFLKFQSTPDRQEDLDKIPSLKKGDLPKSITTIDTREDRLAGVRAFEHTIYTNGIVYFDIAFDIRGIPDDLHPYLPLFSRAVSSTGLPGMSYDELSRQLTIKTGGFGAFLETSCLLNSSDSAEYLFFRVKALESDFNDALDLVRRMLLTADFSNKIRVRDIVLEQRNDFRSHLHHIGNSLVSLRAGSRISPVLAREELWRGTDQFLFLTDLGEDIDSRMKEVIEALTRIRELVIGKSCMVINITADGEMIDEIRKLVIPAISSFPEAAEPHNNPAVSEYIAGEALILPAQVGYVGTAIRASKLDTAQHAYESLIGYLLQTNFLWERIRMQGGAYGASAGCHGAEQVFIFSSYRDPNILSTIEAFTDGLAMLAHGKVSDEAVEKGVISIVGKDARPLSPGEKSLIGFRRSLYGIDDDLRLFKRRTLLSATKKEIVETAGLLLSRMEKNATVVLAGRDAITKASQGFPELGERQVILPL